MFVSQMYQNTSNEIDLFLCLQLMFMIKCMKAVSCEKNSF